MNAEWAAPARLEVEHDLVRRIAAGDQPAFAELYGTHSSAVFNYLLRLVNEPAVAEELLQEVFLAAWRGASRFRAEARVKTWLLRIAHHQAVSWLRRHRPTTTWDDLAEVVADEPIEEAWNQRHTAEQVRRALDQLSVKHRSVVELTFVHDLAYTEIAEIVGCPVGTVKSRMSYALRHLDKVLREMELEH